MIRGSLSLLGMLAAITIVSQFFRTSNGVIGPELIRDLGLTPAELGIANGAFFLALGLAQIPVGMAFDRYGPRRTVTGLTIIAVAGALLHAIAFSAETLAFARLLIGFGCAGSFMGAVVLCSRWFADRFTTVLSWVFAMSNLGAFMSATPLAAVSETVGWRWGFFAAAGITALVGLLFFAVVRDHPENADDVTGPNEALADILRGVLEVWQTPGLLRVLAIHTFAYASMLTVLGLWAGPYLHDVHGLGAVARGNVLLSMAVAQVIGILTYGPLDRIFNTRKHVVMAGAALTITVLALLALIPQPPLWLAVSLLIALCYVTAYGIVIVAHGRSLFPDRLAGRGVTTVNIAQVVGAAILPVFTGAIIEVFAAPDGSAPEIAYRLAFAFIASMLFLGLLVYSGAKDARPNPAI